MEDRFIIYIDTGGTFSDAVIIKGDGTFVTGKAPTTPEDLGICFFNCIENAAKRLGKSLKELLSSTELLGFGTTAGTNALLTRSGPKLGLITTKGFEDTTIIMKVLGRWAGLSTAEQMHIAGTDRPEPIIPRRLIKGVTERIDSSGKVAIPLYEEEVRNAVKELLEEKVEGIAVVLLWSFLNDAHERRIGEIIQEMAPDMPVSLSCQVSPLIREYARYNSTIINLYISGPTRKLFSQVKSKLEDLGYKKPLLVMQAAGGLSRSEVVQPITTLHSGPVGGLVGVEFFKRIYGIKNAIGSDVGGTSFDVSIIPEEGAKYILEPCVARFHLSNPMMEIISIGAGGGTIAYADEITKKLLVGPQSAGAQPGPVCYGLGNDQPTVTDADVVMNRINPDYFLGGQMKLDRERAFKAIKEKIADPLKMDVMEAAQGICSIIDNNMKSIISSTLGERGLDPTKFALFAFGGAGPTHCAGYTEGIGFEKIIIPPYAAAFSAFGASTANVLHRYVLSPFIVIPKLPYDVKSRRFNISSQDDFPEDAKERFNRGFEELNRKALSEMKEEGFKEEEIKVRYLVEMRYGGQLYEVSTPCPATCLRGIEDIRAVISSFEEEYLRLYGKGATYPEEGIEIITLVVEVSAEVAKPKLVKRPYAGEDPSVALKGKREVFFDDNFVRTNIYAMEKLQHGNVIEGPAIIEGVDTTVVVPKDRRITVDEYLNMIMN